MQHRIKEYVKAFIAICYSMTKLRNRRHSRTVLCYHGVSDGERYSFRRQADFLARHYTIVRPTDILTALDGDKPLLAIIFDDALESVRDNALPVLRERHLPCAIAVPAAYFATKPGWAMDCGAEIPENVMSREAIRRLAEDGWEIHSHTMTHPRLAELGDQEIRDELRTSRDILNTILSSPVEAVCYPHGSFDRRVLTEARQASYRMGFTIEPGPVSAAEDPLAVHRTVVAPTDGPVMFRLKASGAYGIFATIRKLRGRTA